MQQEIDQLFPDTATVEDGRLVLGGVPADELARELGTPVVVYDEATIRASARAYAEAAPGALIAYGTKAFPNVAVLRLLADEGVGADVSTVGELEFAERAGIPGEKLVIHGNNKEDELLRRAIDAGALVVLDSLDELERAKAMGGWRFLIRVTPGIEAETHAKVMTAHHGSKFGVPPEDAVEAVRRLPELLGLHVHVGSQLTSFGASLATVTWVGAFAERLHDELDWKPQIIDLGGGLGARHVLAEPQFTVAEFVGGLETELRRSLPDVQLVLEPGRSLVSRAGVTLYSVGLVKHTTGTTWVTVDGGLSDNPRPAMYGAPYTAVLANRADEEPTGTFAIAGKHCESGDVLIESVELPEPRRGDLLAVPVTGAYTLAMSSTYNAVPRPPAVLVTDGTTRVIRRRETVDDLFALES
jgi:diaminopimelate decarboxylase